MQLIHNDEIISLKFDCKPCRNARYGKNKTTHIPKAPSQTAKESGMQFYQAKDLIAKG